MGWLRHGNPRLDQESAAVINAAREVRERIAEYEKHPDPFRAMTITMGANVYEDSQERNIWRGLQ